jgi:hypothetical protein
MASRKPGLQVSGVLVVTLCGCKRSYLLRAKMYVQLRCSADIDQCALRPLASQKLPPRREDAARLVWYALGGDTLEFDVENSF